MRSIRAPRWPFAVAGATALLFLLDVVARRRSVRRQERAGLIVVQIDGLSDRAFRAAMAAGFAPFLRGLVEDGAASVQPWRAMVPPTTPASQAGVMHGRNDNIPGFRWYEKDTGRLLVTNHPGDALDIVARLSDGHGLLSPDGASIGNLMTGDARRTYLTMATVAEEPRPPGTLIRLRTFFVSPLSAIGIVTGVVRELVLEFLQARRQHDRRIEPRMRRGIDSAVERAVLNSALRTISTQLVVAEARHGTPVIYVDYTGYDGVAHHAGPERRESLHTVFGIDREIRAIMAAVPRAARPYHLVVLSDHGQTLGMPFARQFGEPLEAFVARHMTGDVVVRKPSGGEHGHGWSAIGGELVRLTRIGSGIADALAGGLGRLRSAREAPPSDPDLVVCASGNLAHLYFPFRRGRLTVDDLEAKHPGLIRSLIGHAGVGFALVRAASGEPVVRNATGTRNLVTGAVEGTDPLLGYPTSAVAELRRLDGFTNTGDVVLMGAIDPTTGVVISFEDLVGCHGGLGGPQSEPFILYPSSWNVAEPIVGAPAVYRQLRAWLSAIAP